MIKKSIYIGLVISLLLVLLTGCNSKEKELLGKWEELDYDDDYYEFMDAKTMMDGSYKLEYEVDGDQIIVQFLTGKIVYEYEVNDIYLTMKRYGEDNASQFIRVGSIKSNPEELKKLSGNWGQDEEIVTFNEDGTMSVKGIYSENIVTNGPFEADKGIIRFVPEPYETNAYTFSDKYLYLKYDFVGDKLQLSFFDKYTMENVAGSEDVEYMELSKVESMNSGNEATDIKETTSPEDEKKAEDNNHTSTTEETKEPVVKKEIEVDKIHIESVELEDTLVYVTLNNSSSEDVIIPDTGIVLILADNNRVRPYVGSLVVTETVPKGTTMKVSNYYSEINEKNIVAIEVFDNDNVLLDRIDFGNSLSEYLYGDTSQPSNENSVLVGKYLAFNDQGLADEYVPSIEFYDDNTFKFIVNIYAGMAESFGRYEIVGAEVQCIIDKVGFSGSVGDDVESFYMTLYNDGQTLQYMGEPIGMTEKFHFFNRD